MTEATQAILPEDIERAEKFRRGIGGRYDRDVDQLAAEFARCRLSHSLPGDVGVHSAVERFLADYDDGDRADAGVHPLMEAHIADFRAALTPSALSGGAGETLETIIAWGDQTFGPCSQDRAIERAGEEWSEMEEDGADVPIEAADVIICLLRIPGILDAINRKMAINRGRTWDIRPDGTGYHVKAAALPSHPGDAGEGE